MCRWAHLLKLQSSITVYRLPTKENKLHFPFPFAAKQTEVCRFPFLFAANKQTEVALCSETMLTGESRFHISTPLGI
jgi:hypothetical protein